MNRMHPGAAAPLVGVPAEAGLLQPDVHDHPADGVTAPAVVEG